MNAALKLSDPQRIILRLRELRLPQDNEAQMQTAFAEVLDQLRIVNTREHRFNATDRVDFFTADGLAIELKIDGTRNSVLRQLIRYADHENVRETLLITTCARHRTMPAELRGKPLTVYQVLNL